MKASEARKASDTNAERMAAEKAAKAEKARLARIESEKKRRKEFVKEFSDSVDSHIRSAVQYGEKSARVWVGGQTDSSADAHAQFDKHEYLDEIRKILGTLQDDGYKVTTGNVECTTHTTQHESTVPDYDYYTYHSYIEISWE